MIRDVVGHLRKLIHCEGCDRWIATCGPLGEVWELDVTLELAGVTVSLHDPETHLCSSCLAKCLGCGRIHPAGECQEAES